MFSLQQFEEAEERVQEWHGEMNRCMSQERAQDNANGERRSALALLAHCFRRVTGRQPAQLMAAPPNVVAFHRGSER